MWFLLTSTCRGCAISAPASALSWSPTRSRPVWVAAGLWGVDHWDVQPDILCVGKSIGGGVMPLSAFISTPEIWRLIPNPIIHSTTFGNPIACAAGIAAIQVTLEEDLPGQRDEGDYLLTELRG